MSFSDILNEVLEIFLVDESRYKRTLYVSTRLMYRLDYTPTSVSIHRIADAEETHHWHIVKLMGNPLIEERYTSFLSLYREDLFVCIVEDEYGIV